MVADWVCWDGSFLFFVLMIGTVRRAACFSSCFRSCCSSTVRTWRHRWNAEKNGVQHPKFGSWTFQYHFHSVSHQNGQRLRVSPHWPGMTRTWSSKGPKVARRLVHSSMDTVPDFFVSYDTYNAWGQLGPRPLGWKWDELTHVGAHRFT